MVAVALCAVGCTGGDAQESAPPPVSTTATTADDRPYADPRDLMTKVKTTPGLTWTFCDDRVYTDMYGSETFRCTADGSEVITFTWTERKQLVGNLAVHAQGQSVVIGHRWHVVCVAYEVCQAIAPTLGGRAELAADALVARAD
jgi:hypothetical protein